MRSSRIRLQVAVLVFILIPASAGVLAVHASATCERFVRTYVTRPVRNRLSKETADAWAAWRIAHPNWKANPNHRRPRYLLTREEAVHKVDLACNVDTNPVALDLLLTPTEVEPPPVEMSLPPMTTELRLPNPGVPQVTELAELVQPAVFGPLSVVVPGPVPEPESLVLALTGVGFLSLLFATKALRPQQ